MGSVTLHTLWLNDAGDLSDNLVFPGMSALSVSSQIDGGVRKYAGGRLRTVTRAGLAREIRASFDACTRAEVAWLEEHIGRVLLIRDDRGRKMYGVYYEVPVDEHQYDDEADVSLTFVEVSRSEAV